MNNPDFDVDQARRDTPGCRNVIHFNNAGASLMPRPVLDAVVGHLRLEAEIGGYEAAEKALDSLRATYNNLARLIGCGRKEIAVVENATRAFDMAFYAVPFRSRDRILTSTVEYASNYLAYLQLKKRSGVEIEVIPDDESGQVSVDALRRMIDGRTRLVAVTHVPTNGGLVNPAGEIGRVTREAGVLYLLDACQSVGQMPIDVGDIGCDMLSATSRKFLRGPRGIGFLYVRKDIIESLEPPFLDLHAARWTDRDSFSIRPDAKRFENWEANCAAKIGLGAAAEYALGWGLEMIWERVSSLAETLRSRLGEIPAVRVLDRGAVRCGIVSFAVSDRSSADVKKALAERHINVSVSPGNYTLIDMQARGLEDVVRASVHYYNTDEEIDRFCLALGDSAG